MDQYILALDQGTTSSRAIVFDRDGRVGGRGPAGVRADPARARAWSSTTPRRSGPRNSAWPAQAMAAASLSAGDIAALGVTNQRETTILWDRRTGRPVANAIVWQSRVSAGICDRLKADGCEADVPREDRPAAGRLFLRHQDQAPAWIRTTASARRAERAKSSSAPSTPGSSGG